MEDMERKIDESWKDNVEKEKQRQPQEEAPELEPSFPLFISGLGMQALVALGEMENPITKKKETDLNQARYLIDILQILQEKTSNNATDEEKQMLDGLLYQLRMVYVEKLNSENKNKG